MKMTHDFRHFLRASRDGAVVRAFTCHQCDPCLIARLSIICGLSLLLDLVLALRSFKFQFDLNTVNEEPPSGFATAYSY